MKSKDFSWSKEDFQRGLDLGKEVGASSQRCLDSSIAFGAKFVESGSTTEALVESYKVFSENLTENTEKIIKIKEEKKQSLSVAEAAQTAALSSLEEAKATVENYSGYSLLWKGLVGASVISLGVCVGFCCYYYYKNSANAPTEVVSTSTISNDYNILGFSFGKTTSTQIVEKIIKK